MSTRKGLITVPAPCRVTIRKCRPIDSLSRGVATNVRPKMWVGHCTCGKNFQYWDFGATLGAAQEHFRRRVAEQEMNGE